MKYFTLMMILVSGFISGDQSLGLRQCLSDCYHIEAGKIEPILEVFKPLLNDSHVIEEFISQSKALNIDFTTNPSGYAPDTDPVLIAPDWHHVLYESLHVRVLLGDLQPHELEPAHKHSWKRILVIIHGAKFEITSQNNKEIGEWPPGSYLLDPETEPFSSLNLSDHPYRGLTFEIKN